ncbi:PhzF family phenazine biosynthesis protein [Streptacidiphilus monticola]|uniref:PhzF family phenazine biosynthesis protein n=1 Tax=Streptacidiphilus monticola TaxID=2161674 RepID=A0ABW1FZA4_9ACTN
MRIRIVDAFTETPFSGNQAGVCLLSEGPWPHADWMQALAAELHLSETAFPKPRPDGDWDLRWFTPNVEVDLCGHATLATAHLLGAGLHRFHTASGPLEATVAEDGLITLDFPANPTTEAAAPVPGLADALGAEILTTHHTGALGDILVELADEKAVRGLNPDHRALRAYPEHRGFIATAPAADPAGSGYDFVSRWFGAGVDVGEDPVTGSAHTALGPFWSQRLDGRTELTGRQVSPRGGTVVLSLRGDRVLLRGRAVTVLDGELSPAASRPTAR